MTGILKPALAHALVQLPSPVRQLMGYQCLTLSLIRPRAQVAESRAWIVTRERIEVAQISKFVTSAPAHVSIRSLYWYCLYAHLWSVSLCKSFYFLLFFSFFFFFHVQRWKLASCNSVICLGLSRQTFQERNETLWINLNYLKIVCWARHVEVRTRRTIQPNQTKKQCL